MMYASRLDEFGKPAWIAATVLSFWFFWPLGLAVVLFLALSGRLREWRMEARGRWSNAAGKKSGRAWRGGGTSGNHAFDAYRSETIQRLEDEQREFSEYLERLRQARDKAEFDQFMADRSKRPEATGSAVAE